MRPRKDRHSRRCGPSPERGPPGRLQPIYTGTGTHRPGRAWASLRGKGGLRGAKGSWRQLGGRGADGAGVRGSWAGGRRGGTQRPRPADPGGGAGGGGARSLRPPGKAPAGARARRAHGAGGRERRYARRERRAGGACALLRPPESRVRPAPPPLPSSSQGQGGGAAAQTPVSSLTLASLTPLGAIGRPLPGTPPPRGRWSSGPVRAAE